MNTHTYIYGLIYQLVILPLILSMVPSIIIYELFKNSINKKLMFHYFIIGLITAIVLHTGSYLIVLPVLVLTVIKHNDNPDTIKILLTIYITYFILSFKDLYIHINYNDNIIFNVPAMIVNAVLIPTAFIVSKLIKVLLSKKQNLKKTTPNQIRLRMILVISIPLTLLIFSIFPFIIRSKTSFSIMGIIPSILPLISVILILVIVYYFDKSVEFQVALNSERTELNQLREYTDLVENMYSETRKFKHDYMNMITSLNSYIENKDMTRLQQYFNLNIINMDKNINWNNSNIDKLKYIKIMGLKGLISSKLIKAITENIDIKVHIVEYIDYIFMDTLDLCRILGIFLDNAIEASIECEFPKIQLALIKKDDYISLIIENNFFGEAPKIHNIFKDGFSTKGSNRGIGLFNVKEIIDKKYPNVLLNTLIEDNMFINELWIKNNCIS
ncbi:MAG: sensor histidine kinase [Clostridium sp.]|uniref:sensor histidine kinase n=1 Tax=Clostridium sp. TaxID=1506 RepID=UPI003D6D6242